MTPFGIDFICRRMYIYGNISLSSSYKISDEPYGENRITFQYLPPPPEYCAVYDKQ